MDSDLPWKGEYHPAPGAWRDESSPSGARTSLTLLNSVGAVDPDPLAQSKLLELLGLINYRILSGHSLYIEANGAVYKILFGGYWRSVFTGAEHYFLRCDRVADGMWVEGGAATSKADLAISYTDGGWLVKGHSLKFMLHRD